MRSVKSRCLGDFTGGPVVKTPCSHCRGCGFDPWSGTKILHAVWRSQNEKKNCKSSILQLKSKTKHQKETKKAFEEKSYYVKINNNPGIKFQFIKKKNSQWCISTTLVYICPRLSVGLVNGVPPTPAALPLPHRMGHTEQATQNWPHRTGHTEWATQNGPHRTGHTEWATQATQNGPHRMGHTERAHRWFSVLTCLILSTPVPSAQLLHSSFQSHRHIVGVQ